jgi:hypothetical protein
MKADCTKSENALRLRGRVWFLLFWLFFFFRLRFIRNTHQASRPSHAGVGWVHGLLMIPGGASSVREKFTSFDPVVFDRFALGR